jgi:hypothetical protein
LLQNGVRFESELVALPGVTVIDGFAAAAKDAGWNAEPDLELGGHRARLAGTIGREWNVAEACLYSELGNERGLRRALHAYVEYYQRSRTHLALDKDSPVPESIAPPARIASSPFPRSAAFTTGTNVA